MRMRFVKLFGYAVAIAAVMLLAFAGATAHAQSLRPDADQPTNTSVHVQTNTMTSQPATKVVKQIVYRTYRTVRRGGNRVGVSVPVDVTVPVTIQNPAPTPTKVDVPKNPNMSGVLPMDPNSFPKGNGEVTVAVGADGSAYCHKEASDSNCWLPWLLGAIAVAVVVGLIARSGGGGGNVYHNYPAAPAPQYQPPQPQPQVQPAAPQGGGGPQAPFAGNGGSGPGAGPGENVRPAQAFKDWEGNAGVPVAFVSTGAPPPEKPAAATPCGVINVDDLVKVLNAVKGGKETDNRGGNQGRDKQQDKGGKPADKPDAKDKDAGKAGN